MEMEEMSVVLPEDWREQAEELHGEMAKSVKEQKAGIYDYTCPWSEVARFAIVLREEGRRKVFLWPNYSY